MIAAARVTLARLDASTPLVRFRLVARQALAVAVFAVESLSLAVFWFLLLTFFFVRADLIATMHEWGSFLTHFVDAPPPARRPVILVAAALFASILGFVVWLRLNPDRRAHPNVCEAP